MKDIGSMTVMVFDSNSWSKVGDIGDNSCFWKPATILRERISTDGELLVDVLFSDGRESNGHFKNVTKSLTHA